MRTLFNYFRSLFGLIKKGRPSCIQQAKGSVLNFWINIQPALIILKNDLFKTAKRFFNIFQLFLVEIIKKVLTFLIEILKRLLKNERVLNRFAFYLALLLLFWLALVVLKNILLNRNKR